MTFDPAPALPTEEQVDQMRAFLARVIRTPLMAIKVTGDPATDRDTDLLKSYSDTFEGKTRTTEMEKLCTVEALQIDSILAGEIDRLPDGKPDLARGARLFSQFIGERANLYP